MWSSEGYLFGLPGYLGCRAVCQRRVSLMILLRAVLTVSEDGVPN